jgi:hypothetical protein
MAAAAAVAPTGRLIAPCGHGNPPAAAGDLTCCSSAASATPRIGENCELRGVAGGLPIC